MEHTDYDGFQSSLMRHPSKNSSFSWEIKTLRSRNVLIENAYMYKNAEKIIKTPVKKLKKSNNFF